MNKTPFETYCLFIALKNHFRTSYDYFKYNKKAKNLSYDKFNQHPNKFHFRMLSELCDSNELEDYIIANMSKGVCSIHNLVLDEAQENYRSFVKRKQSFTHTFTNELEALLNSVQKPADLFRSADGSYPPLITEHLSSTASLETVCVINKFVDFVASFDRQMGEDDVIWSRIRTRMLKLTPFIVYDRKKIRAVMQAMI
jgi:hypothetical protein